MGKLSSAMLFTVKKIIAYGVFPFAGVLLWANDSSLIMQSLGWRFLIWTKRVDSTGGCRQRRFCRRVKINMRPRIRSSGRLPGSGESRMPQPAKAFLMFGRARPGPRHAYGTRGRFLCPEAEDWMWQEKAEDGVHKMAFRKDGWSPFQQRKSLCSHP